MGFAVTDESFQILASALATRTERAQLIAKRDTLLDLAKDVA